MKKFVFIFSITLVLFACGGNKSAETTEVEENTELLSEYTFKVVGLNDSIIADSIWKMIFTVEGIDQLNLMTNDSLIMFKVDPAVVNSETLAKEITGRGGTVLN